jgi:hypothetical protein
MPLDDVSKHGIEMLHAPCSLVYHGVLNCEGAHVCCLLKQVQLKNRNKDFDESSISGKLFLPMQLTDH